jgi:hypothetical protein
MLTNDFREFIVEINRRGSITKKTQKLYFGGGYYERVWKLRDLGIVNCDGITTDNEKVWVLTSLGKSLAELYIKENKLIGEETK